MRGFHFRRLESPESALTFLSSGESYLSADGFYWYHFACHQCATGRNDEGKQSLAKAFILDPDFRELAKQEYDLKPVVCSSSSSSPPGLLCLIN